MQGYLLKLLKISRFSDYISNVPFKIMKFIERGVGMTILFMTLILSLTIFILIIIGRREDEGLFSPVIISLGLIFLTNVPYMISIALDYDILNDQIKFVISQSEIGMAITKYTIVLIIGIISMLIGMRTRESRVFGHLIPSKLLNENEARYSLSMIFAFLIGIIGYIIFFNSVGGIKVWLSMLSQRAEFTTGNGYLTSLMGFTQIATYIYICTFKYKNNKLKKIILTILIIAVAILSSTLGGRKDTLLFLVFCFLVWNFAVKPIKKIPVGSLILLPIILIYIVAVPLLRAPDGIQKYSENPSLLIESIGDNLNTTTKQISYIDHQLFIMDYFTLDKLWLGKSYLDLLYAPIPRSVYNEKPPIDDGTYIRTLAQGKEVSPPTAYDELYQSSWPPETFGAMYMNFSVIGVAIGMFILGFIYNAAYNYMVKSNYSLFSILIYGNIILNFHLSNLRIVQTISELFLIYLFLSVFFVGSRNKKNVKLVLR